MIHCNVVLRAGAPELHIEPENLRMMTLFSCSKYYFKTTSETEYCPPDPAIMKRRRVNGVLFTSQALTI